MEKFLDNLTLPARDLFLRVRHLVAKSIELLILSLPFILLDSGSILQNNRLVRGCCSPLVALLFRLAALLSFAGALVAIVIVFSVFVFVLHNLVERVHVSVDGTFLVVFAFFKGREVAIVVHVVGRVPALVVTALFEVERHLAALL